MIKVIGPVSSIHSSLTRMFALLAACLMLVPSSASASFRNALEAYANRNVVAMHAEIDKALQRENYDGLILFSTTVRVTLSKHASPEWMEQHQRDALLKKLSVAANQSGISSLIYQDLYYSLSRLKDNYIDAFETLAKADYPYASHFLYRHHLSNHRSQTLHKVAVYWLEQAAHKGLAFAQLQMAGIYLRLNLTIGVEAYFQYIPANKDLGISWLRKAAASYDRNKSMFDDVGMNTDQMRFFAYEMVRLFADRNNTDFYDPNEAQRWLLLAENSPGTYVDIAAKRLLASNRLADDEIVHKGMGTETSLPIWVEEPRQRNSGVTPIFTYKFSKTEYGNRLASQYWIDLYADGSVFIGIPFEDDGTHNFELAHRLSPETIDNFISDLKTLDLAAWPSVSSSPRCFNDDPAPFPCPFKSTFAVFGQDKQQKQVFLHHSNQDARDQLRIQRIEALNSLVIKYFDHTAIRLIARD